MANTKKISFNGIFKARYGERKTRWLFGKYIATIVGCDILALVFHFSFAPDLAFVINIFLILCTGVSGAYSLLRLYQRNMLALIEKISKNPEIEKLTGRGGC